MRAQHLGRVPVGLRDAAMTRVEAQQQREPSLARVGAFAEVIDALRT